MQKTSRKYSKKDFVKYSKDISQGIELALTRLGNRDEGASRKLAQAAKRIAAMTDPPHADDACIKRLEAIDKRILAILDGLDQCCRDGSVEFVGAYADMLYDAIMFSRVEGKEKCADEYNELCLARIDTERKMASTLKEIDACRAAMEQAIATAMKAQPDSNEYKKARFSYCACQNQQKKLAEQVKALQKQYEKATERLNWYEEARVEPPRPVVLDSFEHADWCAKCEDGSEKNGQIDECFDALVPPQSG